MDQNLQAVLLFQNHQTTTPQQAMPLAALSAMAVPVKEPPPAEPAPEPAPAKEEDNG